MDDIGTTMQRQERGDDGAVIGRRERLRKRMRMVDLVAEGEGDGGERGGRGQKYLREGDSGGAGTRVDAS